VDWYTEDEHSESELTASNVKRSFEASMGALKMQEWKMREQTTGVENAGAITDEKQ